MRTAMKRGMRIQKTETDTRMRRGEKREYRDEDGKEGEGKARRQHTGN